MKLISALFHALVFLAFFSLEVTVNAAPLEIQQEPKSCIKGDGVCAVENISDHGFDLEVGQTSVTLDRASSVIRQGRNEIRLLKGTAWIRTKTRFTVKTEFGDAMSVGEGDFWVSRTKTDLTAIAISTDVELAPRGTTELLTVSQGLQNSIGSIGFDGRAQTGIPLPIPFKDHLLRWARLYRGPKKDFAVQVDAFRMKWEAATTASAEINKDLYDRKIASVEAEKSAQAAARAKVEAERAQWKKLFRQRTLGE